MTELYAVVRFLNLTTTVLVVGIFGFALFIARPAYREAKVDFLPYLRSQLRDIRWALAATFLLALLGLGFQVLYVGEPATSDTTGFGTALPLLIETRFGRVWLLRMALLVILVSLIGRTLRAQPESSRMLLIIGFLLAACLLLAPALAGHASAAEGFALALQVSADMLHLLACGLWVGGMWPLFVLLRRCRREGDAIAFRIAAAVTQDFSRLALTCVAVLIATGSYNAWQLVGGFAPLFGTDYGQLLLLKLGLLLPLLALGAANLFQLKPRIVEGSAARSAETVAHLGRLARNIHVEIALGLGILLVVAHMGLIPPARHIQPEWPFAFRFDWSVLDKASDARNQVLRGLFCLAAGFAALLYAAARKHWRIMAAVSGLALWIYAAFTILFPVSIDAYPTTYKRPTIAYEAISVAQGKRLYVESGCPACHGESGYGDGPSATGLLPKPADLTAPHANAHTAGDLFWWISHGVKQSAMPGFAERLSEDERWDLINFLRALSDSERARALAPVLEGEPWLIAPDFSYGTGMGDMATLRDYRADRVVLLVMPGPLDPDRRIEQLAAALPRLRAAGIEVVAVPDPVDYPGRYAPAFIANEGQKEIRETYALFARSVQDENLLTAAPSVEFLIDMQGYIRARWLPSEGDAWKDVAELLAQAAILRAEKSRAPAPDWHVH